MNNAPGKYWGDYRNCAECIEDYKILNEYNQVCLDTIRASGGNNANRFVMIPGLCTDEATVLEEKFVLPVNKTSDKMVIIVHNYIMGSGNSTGKTDFTSNMETELADLYRRLNEKFIAGQKIPVVVGETEAPHFKEVTDDSGKTVKEEIPLAERLKWIKYFGNLCKNYGISVCYWDCGGTKVGAMVELDRINLCAYEDEFVKAFVGALE